jgi:hypothetical protein
VLFPGDGAFDLSNLASRAEKPLESKKSAEKSFENCAITAPTAVAPPLPKARYLVVFDGTWRFAREMFDRNRSMLRGATQVLSTHSQGDGKVEIVRACVVYVQDDLVCDIPFLPS